MKQLLFIILINLFGSDNVFAAAGVASDTPAGDVYVDSPASSFIRKVMGEIRKKDPSAEKGLFYLEVEGKRVFAIGKKAMSDIVDFFPIREMILEHMGLDTSAKIVQIVGDSKEFSVKGSAFGRAFLTDHLKDASVIEYGYTGHNPDAEKGPTRCVNALVSNYIVENRLGGITIANIVGHTIRALDAWGCKVPHEDVKNFVVVYNENFDGGEYTKFGDDTPISDGIMDELLLLDGGMQSLRQVAAALERGVRVFGLTGLRNEVDKGFVSAAALLLYFKAKFEKEGVPETSEDFSAMLGEYFASFEDFDKTRSDADTKAGLMKDAIKVLSNASVYPRILDLVNITEVPS